MELIPATISDHLLETYLVRISVRSRIIYWIIIIVIAASVALLPFIYVDVSIQARGYFQSEIEKQIISSPYQGRVLFADIRSGERVEAGDTLVIIDHEAIRSQQASLKVRIDLNSQSIHDLTILSDQKINNDQTIRRLLQTDRYKAEFLNYQNQCKSQKQKLIKKKSDHERNVLLFEQKIIPVADFENSQFQLKSEEENLNQIISSQYSQWQRDLNSLRNESVILKAEMDQYLEYQKQRIILAPVSGEVIKSIDIQPGGLLNPGQLIAEISPEGNLVATCFVKPSDIGLIKPDQKVKIQVDAFNYNEWGMISATVEDISDDMLIDDNSMVCFRIKCRPDQTSLSLKNGYRAEISKGMSLTARIFLIRRSLFNLLFDKADKWFNPYNNKV